MAEEAPHPDLFPELGAERLLVIVTGSLAATHMTSWSPWLSMGYPRLRRRVVLTSSATRFVSHTALTAMEPNPVLVDAWSDDPTEKPLHVDLAVWPDAVIVYPASFHFLARFAVGLGDTPAMLALQCTSAPVAVAPSVPPGAAGSLVYRKHVEALRERDNVVVVDPVPGMSAHTGGYDAAVAAPLPDVLTGVESLRRTLVGVGTPC
ncbi:flavoprotein [Nocardiopsis changdeensis]|uniref:Flavoprotein n=1 Tax=Nocardiopsis changdeensis TaxID=2831969 RepID=A0ABX8BM79_9ACTN|nr:MULTISPECIES: flavoprotein [Nocardiopsis]QUX23169.1 flavoprotein [Nocardiopsis changdeensis]QYX39112.1 flavoprotein [Nocardiopsis sp. MT53]